MIQLEVVGPGTLTPGLNKDPVYCVQSESVAELELDRPLLAAYRLSVRHNPLQFRNDSRVAEREYECKVAPGHERCSSARILGLWG